MQWNIVADSSIDLFELEQKYDRITFDTVPFSIQVGEQDFTDDRTLQVDTLMTAMKACKTASHTGCPAVGAWYDAFQKPGNILAITITSALSGSYNSACAARDMVLQEQPDKHIAVIDSLSVGPEMILLVRRLCTLIQEQKSFADVLQDIEKYQKHTHVIFALSSFDNLIKNGRMNKVIGVLANRLGLLGVGIASERGTIEMKGVSRGRNRAIAAIVDDMKNRGAFVRDVVISHCQNDAFAQQLKAAILKVWDNAQVTILPTRGLCSYYAEQGGLIIGY